MKKPYLKFNETATTKDKGAQRKQKAYVKVSIPLMQPAVSLKEIQTLTKK